MGAQAGARARPRAAAGAAGTDLCVRARDAGPGGRGATRPLVPRWGRGQCPPVLHPRSESSPEKWENPVFAPVQVPLLSSRVGSGPHLTFAPKSGWARGASVLPEIKFPTGRNEGRQKGKKQRTEGRKKTKKAMRRKKK